MSSLPAFSAVTMASTPGEALAAPRSIALDPSLGDRRADDIAVGLVQRDVVPFIGVRRGAGDLKRTVDAADGFADHLELVDPD